ncbi:hypothetical protein CDAR_557671 [Caerostris darwini]|uniref:Uncharacterized protein n=1 Tax=Caerostris darwini TaxID=1538125 RepID=A0AAV4VAM2_9ARAC|nr:hypothetical protein CDAR_557671 [Caerostris darwini]
MPIDMGIPTPSSSSRHVIGFTIFYLSIPPPHSTSRGSKCPLPPPCSLIDSTSVLVCRKHVPANRSGGGLPPLRVQASKKTVARSITLINHWRTCSFVQKNISLTTHSTRPAYLLYILEDLFARVWVKTSAFTCMAQT